VLDKEPEINSEREYTKAKCQQIAADLIGAEAGALLYRSDENGKIPAYNFSYKYMTVSITKHGGRLLYIINDSTVSAQNTTEENAINNAKAFLKKAGYDNMAQSYYAVYDNICIINFAYCANNIMYYSDLIKVGVSLETGRVYSFEAIGYLTNHTKRIAFDEALSEEELTALLPNSVTVAGTQLCVIPRRTARRRSAANFTAFQNERATKR
jgi:germination protein YpeB